jgi:hypothetical protein
LPRIVLSPELKSQFCFLVSFDKNKFLEKHKSSSKWFRTLSNSNQILGYETNRKFWKDNFLGGFYTTFDCDTQIVLYFVLEKKSIGSSINELSLKSRITKTSFGIFSHIIFNKELEIENYLLDFQNCIFIKRNIGEWYKKPTNLN